MKKSKTPGYLKGGKSKGTTTGRAPIGDDEKEFLRFARPHLRRFELDTILVQLVLDLKQLGEPEAILERHTI